MQMSEFINLTQDENGHKMLILKGEWNRNVEKALEKGDWEKLVLFGVEWEDYSCLVPYRSKITWLEVAGGPTSDQYIDKLEFLKRLKLGEELESATDFRSLSHLERLEVALPSKFPMSNLTSPNLKDLRVVGVTEETLESLKSLKFLEKFEAHKGKLKSLLGIESLTSIQSLTLSNFRNLESIAGVKELKGLKYIDFESLTKLQDIEEIKELKELKKLAIDIKKAKINSSAFFGEFKSIEEIQSDVLIEEVQLIDFLLPKLKTLIVKARLEQAEKDVEEFFNDNNKIIEEINIFGRNEKLLEIKFR